MKRLLTGILLVLALGFQSCKDEHAQLKDGLYAELETDKGTVLLRLDYENAPVTVANFITLAEGTNPFVREEYKDKNLYDGIRFHRVISKNNGDAEDFMVQTGDPSGTGSGDAGYKFKDEISKLRFDKGGLLAMANSGPGTNSSQFFITIVPTPWLDRKHTIFGRVEGDGMSVVEQIKLYDQLISVTIIRKGEAAKKFDAVKVFSDYFSAEAEKQKKQAKIDAANLKVYEAEKQRFFAELRPKATVTKSGLAYYVLEKGNGGKPNMGDNLLVQYAGFFENGTLFDTSRLDLAKKMGNYNAQKDGMGGYAPLPMQAGAKAGAIPGFMEGLNLMHYGDKVVLFIPAALGYGETGAGKVIPPNTDLIFELELVKP